MGVCLALISLGAATDSRYILVVEQKHSLDDVGGCASGYGTPPTAISISLHALYV